MHGLSIQPWQGVSLHSPEIQPGRSSYLCLLRRPRRPYWLGTTRHWELSSNFQFYKGRRRRRWSLHASMDLLTQCRSIPDRCSPAQTGASARVFVSPGELSTRRTRVQKAALHHVKRCEKRLADSAAAARAGAQTDVRWRHTDTAAAAPPCHCLLHEQSFTKRGSRSRLSLVRPPSPLALSSPASPLTPHENIHNSTSRLLYCRGKEIRGKKNTNTETTFSSLFTLWCQTTIFTRKHFIWIELKLFTSSKQTRMHVKHSQQRNICTKIHQT